jgi:hypothetical protein
MFRPETVHRLALDKPNEAACAIDTRTSKSSPGVHWNPAAMLPIDRGTAWRRPWLAAIPHPKPASAFSLQPRPGIEIGLRHAVHRHALALFKLGFAGIERSATFLAGRRNSWFEHSRLLKSLTLLKSQVQAREL